MIAVDTNILVYAHRVDSEWHAKAYDVIAKLAEAGTPWAIPAPCLHEFIAIVTHPRIYKPPTPLNAALDQVDAWRESPSLVIISESDGYWERLRATLLAAHVSGAQVHDARIAALCRHHLVAELWSADRDFSRFVDLKVRNPLADAPTLISGRIRQPSGCARVGLEKPASWASIGDDWMPFFPLQLQPAPEGTLRSTLGPLGLRQKVAIAEVRHKPLLHRDRTVGALWCGHGRSSLRVGVKLTWAVL